MERIISPDSIEYQNYIDEITLFFKEKNSHEEAIKKELKKGKEISKYIQNINYYIDDEGNLIKNDDNNGNIIKIVKPKYIDIFERLEILNDEKEKFLTLLTKLRQEILKNPNEELNKNFEENQKLYDLIYQEIKELQNYFSQINNSELIKEELDKLELDKDKYQENLRLIFSQLKILSSDTEEWKQLVRQYLSQDEDSDRYKYKIINEKISKLSKVLIYEENEDDTDRFSSVKAGRLISTPLLSVEMKEKKDLIPRQPIEFKISSNPFTQKDVIKKKEKIKIIKNQKEDSIFFNSRIKDYKFLSNFSKNPFESVLYGYPEDSEKYEWPTVEHYFQAAKFSGPGENNLKYAQEILKQKTPALAKRLGSNRNPPNGAKIREDWDKETEHLLNDIILKTKDIIMINAIKEKFSQNQDIQKGLLDTFPKILIEKSQTDNYWGSGRNGEGLNMLGKIIIDYRNKIKNIDSDDSELSKSDDSELSKSDDSELSNSDKSVEKVILKKKNKKTVSSAEANIENSSGGGKSILKLKGTKKNKKNIGWINEDSLGNKLNDSNYELDKNIETIDLKSLDVDFMISDNDENISFEEELKGGDIDINKGSEIEENLSTIDLNNIDLNSIKEINIEELNKDDNENFKVNFSNSINNDDNIKNIEIKNIHKKDSKINSSTNYFSDIETKENLEKDNENKDENINFINLLENDNENKESSDLKNIKIKIR
jgi:ribA/ribD-fused uncharacterized protein